MKIILINKQTDWISLSDMDTVDKQVLNSLNKIKGIVLLFLKEKIKTI